MALSINAAGWDLEIRFAWKCGIENACEILNPQLKIVNIKS